METIEKKKKCTTCKKKVVKDKLFKIEVDLELGYDNYRQRI